MASCFYWIWSHSQTKGIVAVYAFTTRLLDAPGQTSETNYEHNKFDSEIEVSLWLFMVISCLQERVSHLVIRLDDDVFGNFLLQLPVCEPASWTEPSPSALFLAF